jgi:signal peptide peptidase SppA
MMFNLRTLDQTTWLTEPVRLRQYVERIGLIPTCPTARDLAQARRERLEEAKHAASRATIKSAKGKIGVLPIHGPVEQRMTTELLKLDGTSLEEVSVGLDALLADASVEAIVLHVDSPGGGVYGVEELSDKIFAARQRKKIYAIADSMACSAAYWVASAADVFAVTPGGDVGSVGVYCIHVDESVAMEMDGLSITMVTAGKYKAELAPFKPLTDDARQYLQESVDYTYRKFQAALKRNRGVSLDEVRINFGQGRVVNADDALKVKMVDRIMTFDQLMTKLTGGGGGGGNRAATMEIIRLRHEQRKREAVS